MSKIGNLKDNFNNSIKKVGDTISGTASKVVDKSKETGMVVSEFVKGASEAASDFISEKKYQNDLNAYMPIKAEDVDNHDFDLPKLLYMIEKDIHEGIEACEGAIGYRPVVVNNRICELIRGNSDMIHRVFIPDNQATIYYQNPFDSKQFISLDRYFLYLIQMKVEELESIAHSLGAKYIKIELCEEDSSDTEVDVKGGIKIGQARVAKHQQDIAGTVGVKDSKKTSIMCETKFKGKDIKDPIKPNLVYFKNDTVISQIIEKRFSDNPLEEKSYELKCFQSKDISLKIAASIDDTVAKLGIKESASMKVGVDKQQKSYFMYHIIF